jgi:hypothetical protein
VIDPKELKRWIESRKKRLQDDEEVKGKKKVELPNGIQIHIHMPSAQKVPLTADGQSVATRDAVARFPS